MKGITKKKNIKLFNINFNKKWDLKPILISISYNK